MWYGQVSNGGVQTLAFAPDSRTLYTGDAVGQVFAWEVGTGAGRKLVALTDARATGRFHLSADGQHLVSRTWNEFVVRSADTGAVQARHSVPGHLHAAFALSPDGRHFQGRDPDTGQLRRWDWAAGAEAEPAPFVLPHPNGRPVLAFHPDGATVAQVGFADGHFVAAFDGPTGAERWRARLPGYAPRLAFDPSGARLLVVSHSLYFAAFDTGTGAALWHHHGRGRVRWVSHLAFHPARPLFARCAEKPSKGPGGPAWFGSLDTGEAVPVPDPGFPSAALVAFSPDGLTCAVGSTNRRFAVFDLDV